MEQALKARKLGSATARRKRMQQREIAMQEEEERRTRILLYGYSSDEEEESSEEEGNTYSPIPESQSDRARPSWSLSTVSSDTATTIPKSPYQQTEPASLLLPSILPDKPYVPELVIPQARSPDIDSYFPTNLPDNDIDEEESITEPETPIEVATPVEYCNPRSRPLMISIKTSSTKKSKQESHHRPVSLPQPPPLPSRSGKRVSSISLSSAIPEVGSSVTALPSLPGSASEDVRTNGRNIRRRPVPVLANSEPTLQHRLVTHDTFLQRSSRISTRKIDRPTTRDAEQPSAMASTPPKVSERRISSFPTVPEASGATASLSPPRGTSAKKPVSTLQQRGSSIGLALRTASSTLRNKPTNTSSTTSSSSESSDSKKGLDIGTFPMASPSPLLQPSSSPQTKVEESKSDTRNSSVTSSGSSRLRRVRTTIGL